MALDSRLSISPDPLGNSAIDNIDYSSIKRTQSPTPKKPLQDAHDNIKLQDFYLDTPTAGLLRQTSPTKSIARAENLISPWRIHVTVEAERDGVRGTRKTTPASPIRDRRIGRVPLKGLEESIPAPVKRGRGRPRKSLDGPTKPRGTPHPAKRRKAQDGMIEEKEENEEESEVLKSTSKKLRRRPRKSVGFDMPSDGDTPSKTAPSRKTKRPLESTPTKTRGKMGSMAVTPIKSIAGSDSKTPDPNPSKRQKIHTSDEEVVQPLPEPTVYAAQSSKAKRQFFDRDPNPAIKTRGVQKGTNVSSQQQEINNSMQSSSSEKFSEESQERSRPEDPTDEHHEYDSIIESEGFSMVTTSSLPSARQALDTRSAIKENDTHLVQPFGQDLTRFEIEALHSEDPKSIIQMTSNSNDPTVISSHPSENHIPSPSCAAKEESANSQEATSSSILNQSSLLPHLKRVTPSKPYSSSALPLPIQAPHENSSRPVDKPTKGTPKLARVVRAGIALQGVVRPIPRIPISQSRGRDGVEAGSKESPQERLDDLFSGFGAGTRRELRAGLRLGEELAIRQDLATRGTAIAESSKGNILQDPGITNQRSPTLDESASYRSRLLGTNGDIHYPTLPSRQLPSPEASEDMLDDDRMSWRVDTVGKAAIDSEFRRNISPEPGGAMPIIDESMLRREAEYQREREAVIRQIEEANTSQVIVIDDSKFNDDDDENSADDGIEEERDDGEETDIWQAEANSSNHQVRTTQEASEILFPEQIIKPRRSKLPSLWRGQNQIVYSDEIAHPQEEEEREEEMRRLGVSKKIVTPTQKQCSKGDNSLGFSAFSDSTEFEPDDLCSTVAARFRHLDRDTEMAIEDGNGDYEDEMDVDELRLKTENEPKDPEEQTARNSAVRQERSQQFTSQPSLAITPNERSQQALFAKSHSQHPSEHEQKRPSTSNRVVQGPAIIPREPVVINLVSPGPSRPSQAKPVPSRKVVQGPITSPKILHQTNAHPSWFVRIADLISPLVSIIPRDVPGDQLPLFPVMDIPFRPLSWFTPWTNSHHSHLRTMYLRMQRKPIKYGLHWWSRSAHLRESVVSSAGWEKRVAEWELSVVDEFVDLLQEWGVDDRVKEIDERRGAPPRKRIDEEEILKRLFSLWVGQVMRQEVGLREGERAGVFDGRLERIADRRVL